MKNKYTKSAKTLFALAPMDDVADTVFRQIIASCAPPDLFFTEFTNVDGLQSPGRASVSKKLLNTAKDQPLIAQLWGVEPTNYKKTTEQIVKGEFGKFVGVDINMGCPVKDVIKNGACSALINNHELAADIIQATKEGLGGKLPISVKTRTGFNEVDLSWHEFLLNQGIDMLIVHGRTKKQMSKVPADWNQINEIRKLRDKLSPKTLVIGNGDVKTSSEGLELAKKYKLDGIMIGRGIFNDPFIFSENSPWDKYTPMQKIDLLKRHIELFDKTWHGAKPVQILNKFCKIYVSNFDGASEIRERLMRSRNIQELLELVGAVGIEPTTKWL